MDSTFPTSVLVLASSALGLALVTVVAATYLRNSRERIRLEEQRLRYEYRMQEEEQKFREQEESAVRQLLRQQSALIEKLASPTVNVRVSGNETKWPEDSDGPSENVSDYSELVREISHSLNTPLSQIEVAAARLQSPLEMYPQVRRNADAALVGRITSSVGICKAFLVAFGELTKVASSVSDWNPESLQQALATAAALYRSATDKMDVAVEVNIPDSLPGYSNSYVLSLILPLLENAIEASTSGSEVKIDFEHSTIGNQIAVVNSCRYPPSQEQINEPGFTTKDEDHHGLGLTVVRRLLSSRRAASLDYEVDGESVKFTLTLPGVEDNGQ
jgi:signal transduction histidine kinase